MLWMMAAVAVEPVRVELPAGCVTEAADLPASDRYDPTDAERWKKRGVIAVRKGARKLMLFHEGKLATLPDGSPACWQVGLGAGYPAGHKQVQGDMKTPEGWYGISDRPWSAFYSALTVHYPDAADARAGLKLGRISESQYASIAAKSERGQLPLMETRLGGRILIHGGGGGSDWTLGCIAMNDDDIDSLRAQLPGSLRTQVLILP